MNILNSFVVSFLSSVTFLNVVFAIIRYSMSSRRGNMDNKITYKRLLWKYEVEGLGPCVGECASDDNCASVFFNRVSNQCQGHSITHGHTDRADNETHWRYYIQPFGQCLVVNLFSRNKSYLCFSLNTPSLFLLTVKGLNTLHCLVLFIFFFFFFFAMLDM